MDKITFCKSCLNCRKKHLGCDINLDELKIEKTNIFPVDPCFNCKKRCIPCELVPKKRNFRKRLCLDKKFIKEKEIINNKNPKSNSLKLNRNIPQELPLAKKFTKGKPNNKYTYTKINNVVPKNRKPKNRIPISSRKYKSRIPVSSPIKKRKHSLKRISPIRRPFVEISARDMLDFLMDYDWSN